MMIFCEDCKFWVYGYCLGLRRETYYRDGCEAGEKKDYKEYEKEPPKVSKQAEVGE